MFTSNSWDGSTMFEALLNSPVKLIFFFMAVVLVFFGVLINVCEQKLPEYIRKSFRYGKFAYESENIKIKVIEVPKAWFKHFYVFSSLLSTFVLYLAFSVFIFGKNVPPFIKHHLNYIGGFASASDNSTTTLIALFLIFIQCWRRFYDTQFVSVFSKHSRMNLSHYLCGFIHYFGVMCAILVESPGFAFKNENYSLRPSFTEIKLRHVFGTVLFIWAWYNQYKATVILANLRKNKQGQVVTEKHKLPEGGWFDYLSSPHSTTEMLMYISLTIILWRNSIWRYVLVWVLSNQVETCLLSHWWYKEHFKNFPKNRKALLPFVY